MRLIIGAIALGLAVYGLNHLGSNTSEAEADTITQCGGYEALHASPYYQSSCSGFQSYGSCNGYQAPMRYQAPARMYYPAAPMQYYSQPRAMYQVPQYYQPQFSQPSYAPRTSTWQCGPNGCYQVR